MVAQGHSSHLDESELWVVRGDGSAAPRYEQLTQRGAKQQWPMWGSGSGDEARSTSSPTDRGRRISGYKPAQGEARALTEFRGGRVMWPTISAERSTIAFERDFGIWTYDVASRRAQQVPITRARLAIGRRHRASHAHHGLQRPRRLARREEARVHRSRRSLRGPVRRRRRRDPPHDDSRPPRDRSTWAPDSRRLAYTANRDGAWNLYLYDFAHEQGNAAHLRSCAQRVAAVLTRRKAGGVPPRRA